jgi:hypothetical protein
MQILFTAIDLECVFITCSFVWNNEGYEGELEIYM